MSIVFVYASFPNSRIAPRPATQDSDTFQVNVGNAANTMLRPANVNRTDLTIANSSTTDDLYYSYTDRADMATEGFILGPGAGIDILNKGEIWGRSSAGVITVSIDEGSG